MKVLFTTICRPIGPKHGDGASVGYELLYGQVTRAQGIFSPRAVHHHFSLNYIALNIDAPSTVLQYPSKRELVRELRRNRYDYVGVPFILATFHRMKQAVALVRKHSPHSKVILGGYGTVASDEELKPYADHICREEGVAFMRRLLGEPFRPLPYEHPHIVSTLKVFSVPVSRTGMIFAGLGCANGCDFCSTSHFFKRRHIRLLPTGQDIFDVLSRYQDKDPEVQFTVLDEDFLLNKKRAMEFRDLVLQSGRQFNIFAFASIRALSQYSVSELAELGIDGVWIGYEGTRSGYGKQQGRPLDELFADLRKHGIQVLASMIVGFEYQTPGIIKQEFRGLMRLRPAYCQFLIYGPTPGTPFYERVTAEGKLRPEILVTREHYYKSCTGFNSMVVHPAMTREQIEGMQRWCFNEDFQHLGPSVFRTIRLWMSGYDYLTRSDNPRLRERGHLFGKCARNAYLAFLAGKLLGPNRRARRYIAALEKRLHARLGKPTLKERALSVLGLLAALWTQITINIDYFQHPRLKTMRYRWGPRNGLMRFWGESEEGVAAPELRVTYGKTRVQGWAWMSLDGILDGKTAAEFCQRLKAELAQGTERFVLRFGRIDRADEAGLASVHQAVRGAQGRVHVLLPKGPIPVLEGLRSLADDSESLKDLKLPDQGVRS
ncbi:MAG: hypothetical protein WC728_04945 [Elusimicrobiota bacterium]